MCKYIIPASALDTAAAASAVMSAAATASPPVVCAAASHTAVVPAASGSVAWRVAMEVGEGEMEELWVRGNRQGARQLVGRA